MSQSTANVQLSSAERTRTCRVYAIDGVGNVRPPSCREKTLDVFSRILRPNLEDVAGRVSASENVSAVPCCRESIAPTYSRLRSSGVTPSISISISRTS